MVVPSTVFKRFSSSSIQNAFKSAMGSMGTQAMILTAGRKSSRKKASFHGMTVSSVCSLSVYPKPLLQFNLHLPSYTSASLHDLLYLAIHMFPSTQKAVELGRTFANAVKSPQREMKKAQEDGDLFHEMTTPFRKLKDNDWTVHYTDGVEIPVLTEAAHVFICRKNMVFEIDDHEIWVAEVVDIHSKGDTKGGLLYYKQNFHSLGEKLT